MHADPYPDIVGSGRPGGDLQDASCISDGVVVCDGALFLDAEDVVDLSGLDKGREGAVLEFGRCGEAPVVVGPVAIGDMAT